MFASAWQALTGTPQKVSGKRKASEHHEAPCAAIKRARTDLAVLETTPDQGNRARGAETDPTLPSDAAISIFSPAGAASVVRRVGELLASPFKARPSIQHTEAAQPRNEEPASPAAPEALTSPAQAQTPRQPCTQTLSAGRTPPSGLHRPSPRLQQQQQQPNLQQQRHAHLVQQQQQQQRAQQGQQELPGRQQRARARPSPSRWLQERQHGVRLSRLAHSSYADASPAGPHQGSALMTLSQLDNAQWQRFVARFEAERLRRLRQPSRSDAELTRSAAKRFCVPLDSTSSSSRGAALHGGQQANIALCNGPQPSSLRDGLAAQQRGVAGGEELRSRARSGTHSAAAERQVQGNSSIAREAQQPPYVDDNPAQRKAFAQMLQGVHQGLLQPQAMAYGCHDLTFCVQATSVTRAAAAGTAAQPVLLDTPGAAQQQHRQQQAMSGGRDRAPAGRMRRGSPASGRRAAAGNGWLTGTHGQPSMAVDLQDMLAAIEQQTREAMALNQMRARESKLQSEKAQRSVAELHDEMAHLLNQMDPPRRGEPSPADARASLQRRAADGSADGRRLPGADGRMGLAKRRAHAGEPEAIVLDDDAGSNEEEAYASDGSQAESEDLSAAMQQASVSEQASQQGAAERVRPLTPELLELRTRALEGGAPSEVLLAHAPTNIDIKRSDIQCLAMGEWLNDEVINVYMGMLQERNGRRLKAGKSPNCFFWDTFFTNKLYLAANEYRYKNVERWTKPKGRLKKWKDQFSTILDCDLIIMPVHLGVHWTCAIISLRDQELWYCDSMSGQHPHLMAALARYVADEAKSKLNRQMDTSGWQHRVLPVPQQRNGVDCGVFACAFAEYASRDVAFTFTQDHMEYFRARMIADIMHGSIDDRD